MRKNYAKAIDIFQNSVAYILDICTRNRAIFFHATCIILGPNRARHGLDELRNITQNVMFRCFMNRLQLDEDTKKTID